MYNRSFFNTRLGQASLLSIAAMVTFAVFSSQMAVPMPADALAITHMVELA
jgi:hypothetical protein